MRKLKVMQTGFPGTNRTWRQVNDSIQENMAALANMCGDKTIISGVEITGPTVSNGWIVVDGELIYFQGGTLQDNVVVSTVVENGFYNTNPADNSVVTELPAYETKTAQCTAAAGTFPFSDLKRIKPLIELYEDFNYLHKGQVIVGNMGDAGFQGTITIPNVGVDNYRVIGEWEVTLAPGAPFGMKIGISWSVDLKTETSFRMVGIRNHNHEINAKFNYYILPNP